MQRYRGYLTVVERRIEFLERREAGGDANGFLIQEICALKWAAELMRTNLAGREQQLLLKGEAIP